MSHLFSRFTFLLLLPLSALAQQAAPAFCGSGSAAPVPVTLSELVAAGMKNNPDTRVAWSQAEEASLALGITRSIYGPILAAQAVALHEHAAFPLPETLNPRGYFKSDAEAVVPALNLRWVLYDQGGQDARLRRETAQLAAANLGFDAAHRRVTLLVTQQYYRLAEGAERRDAARAAVDAAVTVEQAAQARKQRGVASTPEVLQAVASAAEARYQYEAVQVGVEDAYMGLMEAAGVRPDTSLCVALPTLARGNAGGMHLDGLVERALAARPEVQAALAQVQAGEAGVQQARAEFGAKLSLSAHLGQNLGRLRTDGGTWSSVRQPVYGIGLLLDVPLYDGQLRHNTELVARSKAQAAGARLDGVRNKVVHEVVKAYRDVEAGRRREQASEESLAAARASFDAALASYRHGVATLPELQGAQASLARAKASASEAHSALLIARAVLGFASGDLLELDPQALNQ